MMLNFHFLKTIGKYNLKYLSVNNKWCFATSNSNYSSKKKLRSRRERTDKEQEKDDEGFRILNLKGGKKVDSRERRGLDVRVLPPRESRMATDQTWSDVWPGQRTFHPASVPLPVRQGFSERGPPPAKWGNVELMKIPNFLHLTPPAIKKHCEALKQFCTEWPKGLETEEQIKKHFPLEFISMDYCYSSPTIRNPLARIATIKFSLSSLDLDYHAKDKFLRLVGDRYDAKTDTVTIVTDKCPLKKQNYDYAIYLLTALYHESWITEPWEKDITFVDLEYYDWDNSVSKKNVLVALSKSNEESNISTPEVDSYRSAVMNLFDDENEDTVAKYKEASKALLFPS